MGSNPIYPSISSSSASSSSANQSLKRPAITDNTRPPKQQAILTSTGAASAGDRFISAHRRNDPLTPAELKGQLLQGILRNDLSKVQEAITGGVSVEMDHQYAPLHLAVDRSNPEIVALLLQRGAQKDINTQDETRLSPTPLEYALKRKDGLAENIAAGLLLYGAKPALLSTELKQQHAAFLNKKFTEAASCLDLSSSLKAEKKRLKVETLNEEQKYSWAKKIDATLHLVRNSINGGIPGLKVEPFVAHYNKVLRDTNRNIEAFYSDQSILPEKRIAKVEHALRGLRPILRTELSFERAQLNRCAEFASACGLEGILVDAVKAGADQEIWNGYVNQVAEEAFETVKNTRQI